MFERMLALSIRQPYAELILRGIKTAEFRSRATRIVGQRFNIYAARAKASLPVWSADLETTQPPGWMIELARQVELIPTDAELPTGVIVGSAVIDRCEMICGACGTTGESPAEQSAITYAWHLTGVQRLDHPRPPRGHPQPVWWRER